MIEACFAVMTFFAVGALCGWFRALLQLREAREQLEHGADMCEALADDLAVTHAAYDELTCQYMAIRKRESGRAVWTSRGGVS